ncbi:Di-sulfide bridge nucleocytoplasmic transport domain-containing protein [Leptodontidium sp. 2 PMI_412]|nr:Di-sulfide bridge nucleocytoplasmic transport domain-containing protein [Leptodontidium sp. 2 PMI_412]
MFSASHSQKRSTESPMDWEWQTQGPTDLATPFPQYKPDKGHKSNFESAQPQSSLMATSSTPTAQIHDLPSTTPQKPFDPEVFSETLDAEIWPVDNANPRYTPDQRKQTQTKSTSNDTMRQPLFQRPGAGFLRSSPGRELRCGKQSNIFINKIRNRKRTHRSHALAREQLDASKTDSDESVSNPRSRKGKHAQDQPKPGFWASVFSYMDSHPNLPLVLSFYVQLAVNIFIAGLTIFGVYTFWMTVRADVDKASEKERALMLNEIELCRSSFPANGCGSDLRAPALQTACENWEQCIMRDPDSIGRARVSAHTFAQIFNSFVEPISYKAMAFIMLTVTTCVLVNNLAFGMFRSRSHLVPPQSYFLPPQKNVQWEPAYQKPRYEVQTPQMSTGYDGLDDQAFPAIMPSETLGHGITENRSPRKGSRSPIKADSCWRA